jgi:glycosyltransferase involved in cell wall biosynthesis
MEGRIGIYYFVGTLGKGGAEGQLLELIEGLDRQRFEPVLVVLKGKDALYERCKKSGVEVIFLQIRGLLQSFNPLNLAIVVRNLLGLYRRMKERRPHIVHGYLFLSYCLAAFMGKMVGAPVIITSRRSMGSSKTRIWTIFHRILEILANRATDAVIANSRAVRDDTIKREGIPDTRIAVIYNGIDQRRFERREAASVLAKTLRIREGAKVVGLIANLIPYKNHRMLIDAIPLIKEHCREVHFLLVGNDTRGIEEDLRAYARVRGVEECMTFAGSRDDMPDVLSLLAVSVLTSREEGFPNVLLESMAAGLPVVATDVGGVAEIVQEGITGYLVPSGDFRSFAERVVEILTDERLAADMGARARTRVREFFKAETMVAATEALYVRLLEGKGISSP